MDFTNLDRRRKTYGGANGKKLSVMIDGEMYMLKLPVKSERNKELSYLNGTASEYIGCRIFNELGIKTQETILGTFTTEKQKTKIAVACKDFCTDGKMLQDFASLKNQIIDSDSKGQGTELDSLIETMQKQNLMEPEKMQEHFWNMFIVDAYIGNWDRHNGNWGFLYDPKNDTASIAPVYDCGSCLYPSADDDTMKSILTDKNKLKVRIFERPTSAIMLDGKRIRYYDFINSLKYEECNNALAGMFPKINNAEEKIEKLIDETPYISNLQKTFFKTMLSVRKELILAPAYNKINAMKWDKFDKKLEECMKELDTKYDLHKYNNKDRKISTTINKRDNHDGEDMV